MKDKFLIFFVFFFVLFSLNCFSLIIDYPKVDYIQQNTNYQFNFKIFNENYSLQSADCDFNLSNKNGSIIFSKFIQNQKVSISADNFSNIGMYYYSMNCNASNDAGFVNNKFEVTRSANIRDDNPINDFVFLICIMFLITFCLFIGIKLFSSSNDKYKEFFVLGGLIFFSFSFMFLFVFFFLLSEFSNYFFFSNIFSIIFQCIGWIFVGFSFSLPILIIVFIVMLLKIFFKKG